MLIYQPFRLPTFDWLTTSYVTNSLHEFEDRARQILEDAGFNQDTCNMYQRDKGNGFLRWLEITSESDLYDTALYMLGSDGVSRLDVAFDVKVYEGQDVLFDKFNAPVKGIKYNSFIDSTGRTIYFGKGDLMLRIYEKGKQLKLGSEENWVRFEFQLRGKRARNMLNQTFSPDEIFWSLAEKYLDILLPDKSSIKVTCLPEEETDGLTYTRNVAIPHIKKQIKAGLLTIDDIIDLLDTFE